MRLKRKRQPISKRVKEHAKDAGIEFSIEAAVHLLLAIPRAIIRILK